MKNLVRKISVLAVTALFSTFVFGQTKQEINKVLDAMAQSGSLDKASIEAAKKELNKMSDEDMQKLLEKGRQMQNDPKIKKKIKEMGLDQAL